MGILLMKCAEGSVWNTAAINTSYSFLRMSLRFNKKAAKQDSVLIKILNDPEQIPIDSNYWHRDAKNIHSPDNTVTDVASFEHLLKKQNVCSSQIEQLKMVKQYKGLITSSIQLLEFPALLLSLFRASSAFQSLLLHLYVKVCLVSSWPNHLPKSPPPNITLGIRLQQVNFGIAHICSLQQCL